MNPLEKYIRAGLPIDADAFRDPPAELSPTYIWIWNAPLNYMTIRRQLDQMREADIRSIYILPEPPEFRPRRMVTTLQPPYLSADFMAYVRYAVDYAKSLGMALWLYDEGGFPSGMACGQVIRRDPSTVRKQLTRETLTLTAGEEYAPHPTALAVFEDDVRMTADDPTRARTLTEYRLTPLYNDGTDALTTIDVDPSEARTTELFIELTHETYKKTLGDDLGGYASLMFTDEPGLMFPAWPSELEDIYRARFGSELRDVLPALFGDDDDPAGQEIRIRVGILVGEIFRRNYFEKLQAWCHDNGIYASGHLDHDNMLDGARSKGYGNPLDILRTFDIPGIDVIWRQIFPYPDGVFMKGGYHRDDADNAFYPRAAASAAHQTGRNLALSETFAVYGNGLTFDQMRFVCNYQYVRGINLINVSLISYGRGDVQFYALPHPLFHKGMPGYENLPLINAYLSRMSYLTTVGQRAADTVLVQPVHDIHARGQRALRAVRSFEEAGKALERAGVDFDVIDYRAIRDGTLRDGTLHVGGAAYVHAVLPEGVWLPPDAETKIRALTPPVPCICGPSCVRVMTRTLPDGTLYFLYNESLSDLTASVTVNDTRPVSLMSCEDGMVYRVDADVRGGQTVLPVKLASGGMAVYLFSDTPREVSDMPRPAVACPLADFTAARVSELTIDPEGMHTRAVREQERHIALGRWPYSFSGSVRYRTAVKLDRQAVGTALLDLGEVGYSAAVYVNGIRVGATGLRTPTPDGFGCSVTFDASCLIPGMNTIEVVVSNTAADAFTSFPAHDFWEMKYLSAYYDCERAYERDSLGGGLYGRSTPDGNRVILYVDM